MFAKINAVRDVLYSIARYCRCSTQQLSLLFEQEKVYPDKEEWLRYLQPFLLVLSAVLFAAGVVFFFAYNWAAMHPFLKLGLLQGLLLLVIGALLFAPLVKTTRKIMLTVGAVLLGALFAVYGQIYHTGANAYDFFLGWTLSIFIWTLVGRSAALWLVFMVVLNLTLHFYAEQLATFWQDLILPVLLFLINAAAVAVWEYLRSRERVPASTRWFAIIVALVALIINTGAVTEAIFASSWQDETTWKDWGLMLLVTLLVYGAGWWYAQNTRSLFYPATESLSLIAIGCTLFIRIFEYTDVAVLLFASLFVIGSTTGLAYYLMHLNKKWYGTN